MQRRRGMKRRPVAGPGVTAAPSRSLPPRRRAPSKDLPPIPAVPSLGNSSLMEVDGDEEEEEMRDDREGKDSTSDLSILAARLVAPTSRQAKFSPLLQGLRRLSMPSANKRQKNAAVNIELYVGADVITTTSAVVCGTEGAPYTGRFANYVREQLNKSRWLSAACTQSPAPLNSEGKGKLRRRDSILSPASEILQSYLDRDSSSDEPACTDSEIGDSPDRHMTRSRARQLLCSNRKDETAKHDQHPSGLLETPPKISNKAPPILLQIALDRPPQIYDLLLTVLGSSKLPREMLAKQDEGEQREALAQILFALRDEAVFLGYASVVALVDAETTRMFK